MHSKRGWVTGLLGMVLVVTYACQDQYLEPAGSAQDQTLSPAETMGKAPSQADQLVADQAQRNFRTHLSGDEEVPAVDTKAQGQAIFKISKDGESISYKLIAANIENVMMAHIHLAPAGANGDVVVWLYPVDGPPDELIEGRFDGVLAEGAITAENLSGDLEGESIGALIEEIQAGNAYVNVHTKQNSGGEIRGQIR